MTNRPTDESYSVPALLRAIAECDFVPPYGSRSPDKWILARAAELTASSAGVRQEGLTGQQGEIATNCLTEVETLHAEVRRLELLLRNCNTARHAAVARAEANEDKTKPKPYDPDDPRGLGHPSSY